MAILVSSSSVTSNVFGASDTGTMSVVVLIGGAAPVRDRGLGALQDINQPDMIKATVKWQDTCYDVRRIPDYIATAFRQAVSGRPGPVFLELPPDVLNVTTDLDALVMPKAGSRVPVPGPSPHLLQDAAALINRRREEGR